jgi:cytoskeletal protein CcmA (bactofilin family)
MFGSSDKKTAAEIDTIVGSSTKVYGNIHYSGKLHVDGEIAGNVVAEKDGSVLTISEGGRIEGNVKVHRIMLNGEVVGDVYAINDIELAADARVRGNLYYDKIEMERGAEVNGKMIHGKPQSEDADPEVGVDSSSTNHVVSATSAVEKQAELVQDIEKQMHQPKIKIS